MRFFILVFSLLLISCSIESNVNNENIDDLQARFNPEAKSIKYVNAYWYSITDNNIRFEKGDKYSVNGVFTNDTSKEYEVIDLNGAFIIPPFGEAHNHSIDGPGTEKTAQKYIDEGVFYYKNANSIFSFAQPLLAYWSRADTLDVSFAHGGLSKDEGHPEKLYRTLSSYGMYPNIAADDFEGQAFYDVDSLEKLDSKWETILSNQPDFLKLYLLRHDTDQNDGLSEDIFREIVKRANALNLKTTVHVETVQDLALAVDAGASEAAHLPAYNLKIAKDELSSKIPDALIEHMAQKQFVVVTTTNVSARRKYSPEDYELVSSRQKENLQMLYMAGVPIAIGSDTFFETVFSEIKTLRAMNTFDDQTLLRLWIETPQLSIFPNRAIGQLKTGYETSFLALECNPAIDFSCVSKISKKIKQGVLLK